MTAAVEITDLVKSYGGTRAVDGLTLAVPPGEVLALLGPNGAGKTTTIEICEGFRRADSGSVRVLGLDPVTDAGRLRPRVGVMLQDGVGGYTGATALELVRLFASYAAHPHDAGELLRVVGLTDAAGTAVKRLSGGQQQRLSLALALVARPELVFLDEPTAGMDPQSRRGTWDLVRTLRGDGVSVVLTTHFLDEAEQLADTVVVMDAGRIVAQGTPAELTRSGAEGQIRFRAVPALALDSLVAALPPGCAATEDAPGHYLVTGEVTPQLLATLTAWCASQQVMADDLHVEKRTLEDVFLDLTGRELRT
ncbi:ABC-2 type transport system ATP-binding protein [Jatrophihabitans endophyticus]|uniref:ABC-2 type transport system ATP-binding protein n=1 Tax=Jatrophihabitans endophyticus TaxID=1206085 RepID=A0A1M5N1Z4_9ACTN|nr:ABC transporter ATP-binding protein [Jatrophihabitans endophyticus]SHG83209.1 ABC-2 type transport system ATP-binding protein [Jatrophihabitans endophyticus]